VATTAVVGVQAGVLIGKPSFWLIAVDLGHAPTLELPDIAKTGYWRLGLQLGTYVSCIDLN
jgi:hypothetical protein